MILIDTQLRERAKRLAIENDHVNPASVDLRLGATIIEYPPYDPAQAAMLADRLHGAPLDDDAFALEQELLKERLGGITHNLEPQSAFVFQPNHFYLAHSEERICMPEDYAALLTLKSTTGRRGLDHLNAGWIDPSFVGQVTFEFTPALPVIARIGDPIVQLTYLRCEEKPARGYDQTGRYQGQAGPTPPRANARRS